MPRMKWGDEFDELPEEYDGGDFEPYDGEEPPAKTVLRGQVKKLWITESKQGNRMLKVLFEAGGNQGKRAEYDGWSVWDQIPLLPNCAFRYMPFLESLGLTMDDLKRRCAIAQEEDNVGTPVLKIGTVKFPANISVSTKREKSEDYGTSTRVQTYMETKVKKTSRRAAEDVSGDEDDDDVPF